MIVRRNAEVARESQSSADMDTNAVVLLIAVTTPISTSPVFRRLPHLLSNTKNWRKQSEKCIRISQMWNHLYISTRIHLLLYDCSHCTLDCTRIRLAAYGSRKEM
ncbi:hypothetical protein M378DRAFT_159151 [Amanita muscaria Koide BX008]|uniref:Uncharacterized protein n=1 Tax=Amanita muscaria (strain Koide BX008) TaxID=946122 RepID=A0A0C2TLC5_AMAMK|nr:hypothetical protein M378DRAFT_159151 [Amanita muscaria Koide BX008]